MPCIVHMPRHAVRSRISVCPFSLFINLICHQKANWLIVSPSSNFVCLHPATQPRTNKFNTSLSKVRPDVHPNVQLQLKDSITMFFKGDCQMCTGMFVHRNVCVYHWIYRSVRALVVVPAPLWCHMVPQVSERGQLVNREEKERGTVGCCIKSESV